ncbi:ATP-binding protein [Ilumatobacter nonamiensis]|uniref:ATP-binding protein n=1 Tax=Ilumatobacter nonamiensis TaxID=467093 RepID=UPI0003473857|nr:ATP-binding protein [Ilumatobacter nonamiensis]
MTTDAPTTGIFRLNMPPSLVSIAISRSAVRRVVTFRDADTESSFLVALTEIVANAIDEHARGGHGRPIVLEVRFGADDLVRVIDTGDGFSDQIAASVKPDHVSGDPEERGRGLALARALVPTIEFETSGAGSTVTLPVAGFGIVR